MEIRCRCPSCTAKFKVDAKYAGKKARCPKCQTVVDVPKENLEESTTSMSSLNLGQPLAPATGNSSIIQQRPSVPVAPLIAPGRAPAPGPAPAMPGSVNFVPQQPLPQQPLPQQTQQTQPQQTQSQQPQQQLKKAQPLSPPQPQAQTQPQSPAEQQPSSPAAPAFSALNMGSARAAGLINPAVQPASHAPADARHGKGHKQTNPVPLILAGGVAAVVFVGISIVAVIAMNGSGTPAKKGGGAVAAASGSATLYIDWPSGDRRGGALTIDGEKRPLSAAGQLKYVLKAGSHDLLLQRRGFEQIETTLTLGKGESQHFAPQWQASALAPATPTVNAPSSFPTPGVSPSTPRPRQPGDFPIGTAASAYSPKGFDGWLQNFDAGIRQAAAAGKGTVVVVFGCSDAQNATQQMARQLQQAGVKSKAACVVIDFPRTSEGFNLVEDRGQNEQMLEDFGVNRLPALALADEAGKVFFIQQEWTDGFDNLAANLDEWIKQRGERDGLIGAAKEGADDEARLATAATAVKWLQDKKIWRSYRLEIAGWLAMAQRVDPNNDKAIQETFFEPQWFLDLVNVNQEDAGAVLRLSTQLEPWATRRFKDQDRGAKLHMTAAMLLAQVEKFDDATKQLEHAVKYKPKDSKLADALNGLKTRLENKDIVGSGTGFLISPAGYVMTNHHVIEGQGRVEVRLPGTKDTVPAEVIAKDADRDMALLKVTFPEPEKFQPVPVVAAGIGRGAEVAAFGFPLGDTLGTGLKFTRGSISALPDGSSNDMYLLDLRVNPGNSGGPLCDARGQVVGMITAKTGNFGFEDSYGMAIPASTLLEFLGQNLPEGTPIAAADPAAAALGWDQVDKKVASGVLMIVKKK